MTRFDSAFRTIYKYIVVYHQKGNPAAQGQAFINAPSAQYIRDNWCAICASTGYKIDRIRRVA